MPTKCPACGVPIAPGTLSCGNCGAMVHPTGRYPVVTPPEPSRRHVGWVVVAALVALVALGGGAAALALRDEGDDTADEEEAAAIDAELDALDQRFSTTTTTPLGEGGDASGTASIAAPESSVTPGVAIADQPSGLSCADLHAAGFPYADAAAYWEREAHDAGLDPDGDGVPCESVYGEDVAAEHWSRAS